MTVFYLVRHAHAVWTPDETQTLSARGQADAERVADLLAPYPIDRVVSSPYPRAYQTVAPLAARRGLTVEIEPDLRERHLGDVVFADAAFEDAVLATWRDFDFAHPGGETNAAAEQRGAAVVRRLQREAPNAHIVLGTHGNLLTLILHHRDPRIGGDFWRALSMPDVYRLAPGPEMTLTRLWTERA